MAMRPSSRSSSSSAAARHGSRSASAVRSVVPLPVVQSFAESVVIPRALGDPSRRIDLRQHRAMRRRRRRRRRPRRDAAATRGRGGEVDGVVFDVIDDHRPGGGDGDLDVRLVVLLAVAGVQVGTRRVVVVDRDRAGPRRRVAAAAAEIIRRVALVPPDVVRGETQRENSREPGRHASPHRGRPRLALVARVSARCGAARVRSLDLLRVGGFQP
mmetsp:Transcript_14481/g.61181  ORF Transcript_14481/g.61181 Transcript_14481/m.61181 type:complete len:214 (-) Transcript_14481:459-1100(-)